MVALLPLPGALRGRKTLSFLTHCREDNTSRLLSCPRLQGYLLMRVKEESEKSGLTLNIQKTKIMASGPITSWQTDGEKVETVADFIFLGSKIIADGDCSHEIKRCLILGRKAMTKLDSVLKSRNISFLTKIQIHRVKAFLVVMYRCESWTIKKAESRRIDAFKLWF